MANRAKRNNIRNHKRQLEFLRNGIVMLPKKQDVIRGILKKNGVQVT